MKERDFAQKTAAATKSTEDWKKFKMLRNRVNNILKTEKKIWQAQKLSECTEDLSKTWKYVKSWLGWTSGGPPTQLMENGNLINKPGHLAECMNRYFINKVKNLRRNLRACIGNPLELLQKMIRNRKCSFTLQHVHPDEVEKF